MAHYDDNNNNNNNNNDNENENQISTENNKNNNPSTIVKENKLPWQISFCLPLWLAYVSNQWSRSSIYYLVNFSNNNNNDAVNNNDNIPTAFTAMNIDLHFTHGQYGILASLAFTALFAIASLGAGVVSDVFQNNRKGLTIGSTIVWSLATLGMALSNSYDNVLACRVLMGLACAFSTPAAYTLLAQNVPSNRQSLAASLYSTGIAGGGALASLSLVLDESIGWRNTCIGIASFGFIAALVNGILLPNNEQQQQKEEETTTTTRAMNEEEKEKSNHDNQKEQTIVQVDDEEKDSLFIQIKEIISDNTRVQWLFVGTFFRFCSGLCIGVWSAALFRDLFPSQQAEYAIAQALITSLCGVASGLAGGVLADRLVSNDDNKIQTKLWIPAIASLLAIPTWYGATHATSFTMAMTLLAVEYLVAECWFGPTVSVLQGSVRSSVGGTAQGLFTLVGATGNVAPSLLGFLVEYNANNDILSSWLPTTTNFELVDWLALFVCGGYLVSAICFGLAGTTARTATR